MALGRRGSDIGGAREVQDVFAWSTLARQNNVGVFRAVIAQTLNGPNML